MAILKFVAEADTTITNAFKSGLSLRGTGSNMGYADSLEVFSIYGQISGSDGQSQELSRILLKFPISSMVSSRNAGVIPAVGKVSFYLKMYNAQHPFTLPQGFYLQVAPISRSWAEGTGLDMDEYKDLGSANWLKADSSTNWTTIGADYLTASNQVVYFEKGYENLTLNVTNLVEKWISGADPAYSSNYGLGVRLTASQEGYFSSSTGANTANLIQNTGGATQSYYTKKFFSRSTEFFFKKPSIEAHWDSRLTDDRENFFYSSSFAPAADNLNSLYFYNYVRGRLVNLPGVGSGSSMLVSIFGGTNSPNSIKKVLYDGNKNVTASWVSTGVYKANIALTGTALSLFDVWHSGSNGDLNVQYFTGSLYPVAMPTYSAAPTITKVTSCTNLKKSYSKYDKSRFRFFVRNRDWTPTLYVKATANNPTDIIESASYAVRRVTDNFNAVPYGTGSDYSTYLSYDKDGNYFDLDMSLLEPDYMYEIKLSYYNDSIGDWQEQPQTFKFRVEE